ncbi:alpha/beta-hydrolase [Chiua virens]|nr:alpha/beta-hydrolase [Chiua virens]
MSLCDKCVSGVRHEGTPEGKVIELDGVKVYFAKPTGDYPKDKAILFLPDVFGIELINARLLADDFAKNGFQVYAIDYFGGDNLAPDALNPSAKFDLMGWLSKHGQDVTRPIIDKVINALKSQGITQFAATGYCFGGRYVFDLAFDKAIKVAAVSHPSLLQVPQDLHKFKETGLPLLINSCEVDQMFPITAQAEADTILGGGSKSSALYKREYFKGCTHGFAVRGDLSIPDVKAGKEGSFKATVEFFFKHL